MSPDCLRKQAEKYFSHLVGGPFLAIISQQEQSLEVERVLNSERSPLSEYSTGHEPPEMAQECLA